MQDPSVILNEAGGHTTLCFPLGTQKALLQISGYPAPNCSSFLLFVSLPPTTALADTPSAMCTVCGRIVTHRQSHHPSSTSPAISTDRTACFSQGGDPREDTNLSLLSADTPTRKVHCFLSGISQIPNVSLRNSKTSTCHL